MATSKKPTTFVCAEYVGECTGVRYFLPDWPIVTHGLTSGSACGSIGQSGRKDQAVEQSPT